MATTKLGEIQRLKMFFHDQAIRLDTGHKCGKTIVGTDLLAEFSRKLERLCIVLESK